MQVVTRLGSFGDVVAATAIHAPTLIAIRELVLALHPDATETASAKERSVWWSTGPAKMRDGYAYAMPHTAHVNLGFFHGVSLPDPTGLLQGTGKALRHVKLISPRDPARADIRDLLAAALAYCRKEAQA